MSNLNPQQFQRPPNVGDIQFSEHQALEPRSVPDWGHTEDCSFCHPDHPSNYRDPESWANHPSVIR